MDNANRPPDDAGVAPGLVTLVFSVTFTRDIVRRLLGPHRMFHFLPIPENQAVMVWAQMDGFTNAEPIPGLLDMKLIDADQTKARIECRLLHWETREPVGALWTVPVPPVAPSGRV